MKPICFLNSCQTTRWHLLFFTVFFLFIYGAGYAHQSPNSLIFLDASPDRVAMEIQLPVPELELAFGNDISKTPEKLVEKWGPQLKEYLLAHIHAYATKDKPWQVEVASMAMVQGTYTESNITYWELVAQVHIKPLAGETTRKFYLDYDVIIHQVMNHAALVSIRNDWEQGKADADPAKVGVIHLNTKDNVIYPLEINLEKGTWWKGFKSMVSLGMQHIKEGTDHLLFLLVLLLPATLLIYGKKWGGFGGTKYSIIRLLKIVTAFTIGHSITLLVGALGWVKLPVQPVEILIALSIFISALHAIRPLFYGKEMYVAAGFGMVHGLAFASVLANLHLGAGPMALSILGFNIGIELMQLIVVVLIIPWLILLSPTPAYKMVRVGGAITAATAALAWIAERITGVPNVATTFIQNNIKYAIWGIAILALLAIINYAWHVNKKRIY